MQALVVLVPVLRRPHRVHPFLASLHANTPDPVRALFICDPDDIDEQRARGDWFLALAAARNRVTDEARSAVDTAMRLVGARGFQADSELARLYRDVLAGMFHPSSSRALASTVRATLR